MRNKYFAKEKFALAIALCFATGLSSAVPPIKYGERPRLLAYESDLARLRAAVQRPGSAEEDAAKNLYAWVAGFLEGFPNCGTNPDYCNITTGERGHILTTAKNIALAYNLRPDNAHLDAAKRYVDELLKVIDKDAGVGGERSMGARIAALGFFYDWMYDAMEADSRRDRIRAAIKKTIATDRRKPADDNGVQKDDSDDLMGYICGGWIDANYRCLAPLHHDNNKYPSIAFGYISGHHATAAMNTLTAIVAINGEDDSAEPLIDVIYDNFDKGFYAARRYISEDGGHQMGYGYGATSTDFGERLILWRKGFETPANPESGKAEPLFTESWHQKIILPFLYGYRKDTRFPASGDNFLFTAKQMPDFVLNAAVSGGPYSGYAQWFYEHEVAANPDSSTKRNLLWDILLYPERPEAVRYFGTGGLPLAHAFPKSGQVLMRDSWSNDVATLVEFKSSSFRTRNHHHLDENAFTIFYKEPLLVDSGSLDKYESSHWKSYYSRTVGSGSIAGRWPTLCYPTLRMAGSTASTV